MSEYSRKISCELYELGVMGLENYRENCDRNIFSSPVVEKELKKLSHRKEISLASRLYVMESCGFSQKTLELIASKVSVEEATEITKDWKCLKMLCKCDQSSWTKEHPDKILLVQHPVYTINLNNFKDKAEAARHLQFFNSDSPKYFRYICAIPEKKRKLAYEAMFDTLVSYACGSYNVVDGYDDGYITIPKPKSNLAKLEDELAKLADEKVIEKLIDDSNLFFVFKTYMVFRFGKKAEDIIAYFGRGRKNKKDAYEFCCTHPLKLASEFDNEKLIPSLRGEIMVKGAGERVKKLVAYFRCSKAQATKYLTEGLGNPSKVVAKHFKYPLRELTSKMFHWWMKKKDSTEWDKPHIIHGAAGETSYWYYKDRRDEIRDEFIETENDSVEVVMQRVFRYEEEHRRRREIMYETNEEKLKAMPKFPRWIAKPPKESGFIQLRTALVLLKAGRYFCNCVNSYREACLKGKSFIFANRDFCAEIAKDEHGEWKIYQCLGKHNVRLPEIITKKFYDWFKEVIRQQKGERT